METPAGVALGSASSPITVHSRSTSVLPRLALSTLNRLSLNFRPLTCPELVEWVGRLPRSPTPAKRGRGSAASRAVALRVGGFTLVELLVVIGIIALLMALVVPAFTNIKSGTDAMSAAYTVKGALDTARTYAKANNTYTWVGLFEEDVSQPSTNPATAGTGRVVMSIVASKDGTIIYDPSNPSQIDATRLTQVGKLTKVDNVHLATFTDGSGTGSTFDTRPPVTFNGTQYRIGDTTTPAPSSTYFQYPVGNPAPAWQYRFMKAVQFSPRGEGRIDNNSYSLQTVAEIGLEPTHGATAPASIPANVVAVQFGGVGGGVTIYRR
jgi:prepilin-type N-terminal cleavage/methylation domain-containing protein